MPENTRQEDSAVFFLDVLDLQNEINRPEIKALMEKGYEKSMDIAVQDGDNPKIIMVLTKPSKISFRDEIESNTKGILMMLRLLVLLNFFLFIFLMLKGVPQ
tara:strand:+ start:411 stop:716 length:306 start_codon:yes stop_codon:yes gene_type:complete